MKKDTRPLPLLLVAFGGLLLALTVFLLSNRNPGIAPTQSPTSVQNEASILRVSLKDARAAFDAGTAVFVDVRSADSYAAGHIPGALSIPLGEIETRLNELKPDQWIITYCT